MGEWRIAVNCFSLPYVIDLPILFLSSDTIMRVVGIKIRSSLHSVWVFLVKRLAFLLLFDGVPVVSLIDNIFLDGYRHINNSIIYYDISYVLPIFAQNI